MSFWPLVVYFLILTAIALFMRQGVLRFLTDHGVTAANHMSRLIPSAAGVLIWLISLAALLYQEAWIMVRGDLKLVAATEYYEVLFLASTIVFCLGWTDDLIGNRQVKGLRGHLRAFRQHGMVSTGLVKAIGTGGASLWLILETGLWRGAWYGLLPLFVMILYTNAMNLFDLRPGRALKVFLLGCAVIIAVSAATQGAWLMLLPAIAGACVLLPTDLKGQGMLGDTGANMLGFVLGSTIAMFWDWKWQAAALAILVGLTLFAERYSLTTLIERIPVLRWLDQLGRQ